jgi:hypothetical protein
LKVEPKEHSRSGANLMKIRESETQRTEGLEAGGDASQNLEGGMSRHLQVTSRRRRVREENAPRFTCQRRRVREESDARNPYDFFSGVL